MAEIGANPQLLKAMPESLSNDSTSANTFKAASAMTNP